MYHKPSLPHTSVDHKHHKPSLAHISVDQKSSLTQYIQYMHHGSYNPSNGIIAIFIAKRYLYTRLYVVGIY